MVNRKLPRDEAYAYYLAAGAGRSYQSVADHYGTSKTAVCHLAKREDWQQRLAAMQGEAMVAAEEAYASGYKGYHFTHIGAARMMLAKALEALDGMTIDRPVDVIRMIEAAVKVELLARDAPTRRVALDIRRDLEDRDVMGDAWPGRHHANDNGAGGS